MPSKLAQSSHRVSLFLALADGSLNMDPFVALGALTSPVPQLLTTDLHSQEPCT